MDAPGLTPKTEKRLSLLFAPADQKRAGTILVEECGTNIPGWNAPGPERLRFAVLKLSDGKLDRLEAAIHNAKRDFVTY
jgi:hypothetical protein